MLIIYATGQYFLVDTATSVITDGSYTNDPEDGKTKNRFLGAQLIDEKVVMVRDKTLGVVEDLKWKPVPAVKLHNEFQIFETLCN